MHSSELIKELEKHGWQFVRARGSHRQYKHPNSPWVLTVPHPKKDLGTGLLKKIRKMAGLK